MPLKLGEISQSILEMARQATTPERQAYIERALELLHAIDPELLRHKIDEQKGTAERTPWLVARPIGTLNGKFAAPKPPQDFSVVAADGSAIPPQRYGLMPFFVINTGCAALTYGAHPGAVLDSETRLYFRDEELYALPESRDGPIEAARLGAKMAVEELGYLLRVVQGVEKPAIALYDGSLILWPIQNEVREVRQKFVGDFLDSLDGFRSLGVPIASYISHTDAQDLVNALRIWLCGRRPRNCKACAQAPTGAQELCMGLASIRDYALLANLLDPGERTDLFESQSAILQGYRQHRVRFFYLNVGGEISRVEVPAWVAGDEEMLDLVHALIVDQCRRSPDHPPYPPALQEAHEQAVIHTAEHRLLEEMIERALAERNIIHARGAKDISKRRRGV
ncbi:MAG: DNA double-strand break repair nuclease NurA [Chloroflexi bacterium]|nr:DNA double-strand break repair nuclease NurA [Chloroflexota bacterium]